MFQVASGGPIYVINKDGSGLRQLTTGMDPALSPDGQKVAFTRWQGSGNGVAGELWVINVDGSGAHLVSKDLRQPKSPTWSPDGTQIVVNQQKGGTLDPGMMPVFIQPPSGPVDLEGCGKDVLVPCYSVLPDPWWYLRVFKVADGTWTDLPSDNHAFAPTWNPTNDWQVIYRSGNGLQSMDVKRDANWKFTADPDDRGPVFSPDGKKVAFSYRQHDHWEVYVMNADGSGRVRLTETPYQVLADQGLKGQPLTQWNNAAPVWSPDGSQIAFLTDRTGKWEFWVMNADGSGQKALFPAGALSGISLRYDGNDERMLSWR